MKVVKLGGGYFTTCIIAIVMLGSMELSAMQSEDIGNVKDIKEYEKMLMYVEKQHI